MEELIFVCCLRIQPTQRRSRCILVDDSGSQVIEPLGGETAQLLDLFDLAHDAPQIPKASFRNMVQSLFHVVVEGPLYAWSMKPFAVEEIKCLDQPETSLCPKVLCMHRVLNSNLSMEPAKDGL